MQTRILDVLSMRLRAYSTIEHGKHDAHRALKAVPAKAGASRKAPIASIVLSLYCVSEQELPRVKYCRVCISWSRVSACIV